jgi:very-short-patch-repair endonuclease
MRYQSHPNPQRRFVLRENARELRGHLTPAEARLWMVLKGEQLSGLRFRRQHPVGEHIADFYCAERMLVIEIDGASHDQEARQARDAGRDACLAERGWRVIRFSNQGVHANLEGALRDIARRCGADPACVFARSPRDRRRASRSRDGIRIEARDGVAKNPPPGPLPEYREGEKGAP